ncbi:MAG: response regulator, partial [Myxococcales bacterium]|nr:response regulator [Myxococcales bacterium]
MNENQPFDELDIDAPTQAPEFGWRILVIDDNPAVHADFAKILLPKPSPGDELDRYEHEVLGESGRERFRIDAMAIELQFAHTGIEAIELLARDANEGKRFDMAFVDMRMPPGFDGIETTRRLWNHDPELAIAISTTHSDGDTAEIIRRLGPSPSLWVLPKPLAQDDVEQLVAAAFLQR